MTGDAPMGVSRMCLSKPVIAAVAGASSPGFHTRRRLLTILHAIGFAVAGGLELGILV